MKSYVKVFKDFTLSHASFPLKVIIFWNHFPCVWYHHDGLIFSPLFIIIHGRHAHSAGAERAKKNVLKRRKKGKIYPRHDLAPFLFSGSFYLWLGGTSLYTQLASTCSMWPLICRVQWMFTTPHHDIDCLKLNLPFYAGTFAVQLYVLLLSHERSYWDDSLQNELSGTNGLAMKTLYAI